MRRFVLIAFLLSAAPFAAIAAQPTCTQYTIPVALVRGDAATYEIAGELCHHAGLNSKRAVLLLLSGNTYGSVYWDFPYEPAQYSFVDHMNEAGYVTLNIDRIGIGRSSRPESALVDMETNTYVVEQIVGRLVDGTLTGVALDRIILVGHSYGSAVGMLAATRLPDVDGLLVTGMLHSLNYGLLENATTAQVAQLDPRFAGQDIPLGYYTTAAGERDTFYWAPGADPHVIFTEDENTKETVTMEELNTLGVGLDASKHVRVPTITIVGDYDDLFCTVKCTDPLSLLDTEEEPKHWPPEAQLEIAIAADTGHDLNLHFTSEGVFAVAREWLDRKFGP